MKIQSIWKIIIMLIIPLLLCIFLQSKEKCSLFPTYTIPLCNHKQVINDNKSSTSITLMSDLSFQQYKKRPFTKYVESSKFFHHLQDEKSLLFSTFSNYFIKPVFCASKSGIYKYEKWVIAFLSFFKANKYKLLKRCTDFKRFSHCQEYYLFQYDSSTQQCHSYYHENCILSFDYNK